MERPLTVFPVSTLTGPLVELKDGSSERIESLTRIREVENEVTQIWEMGDILLSPDDIPTTETIELSAWTEEWWGQEIKRLISSKFRSHENLASNLRISPIELENLLREPTHFHPSPEVALNLSRITKVPIHPYYSFNWNEIAISDLIRLIQKLNSFSDEFLPDDDDLRGILRQLGVPFVIHNGKIQSERFQPYLHLLRGKEEEITKILSQSTQVGIEELVQELTKIPIKSLCHRRIGLKIIRVEKAEQRHINPPAHILFPISSHGGAQRNLLKVKKGASVDIQVSERFCTTCGESRYVSYCPKCLEKTKQQFVCKNGHISESRDCRECGLYAFPASIKPIDVAGLIKSGVQKTGFSDLKKIKGVSFLNNKNRIPEHIIKGILRAKHNVFVYKDGTSRFDQTNAPITHFTPKEAHISVEDLLRLGYTHDVYGNDLVQDDQLIEINPYDVIVSKTACEFLVNLSKFIDDELTFLYELAPYYRINSLNDIIGSLIVGLSPFSMVAVIGRIIGYSDNNVNYAHPVWHILKTRNCNGDIDSITLLLDVLLNFSIEYIPTSRGGTMDVPVIINLSDKWEETSVYASYDSVLMNLSFYHNLIKNPLKQELLSYKMSYLTPSLPVSHTIDNVSRYNFKNLFRESKIVSKIETELRILSRIRGVKEGEFVDDILVNDFLPKITTSMTRFFLQPVRCNTCNTTFRRIPLSKCPVCHRQTIGLTLSEGWVLRYLQIVNQLKDRFNSDISEYCHSWVELVELNKRLLFDKGPRPTTLI
jgi:DNA polymerase II large subunit